MNALGRHRYGYKLYYISYNYMVYNRLYVVYVFAVELGQVLEQAADAFLTLSFSELSEQLLEDRWAFDTQVPLAKQVHMYIYICIYTLILSYIYMIPGSGFVAPPPRMGWVHPGEGKEAVG